MGRSPRTGEIAGPEWPASNIEQRPLAELVPSARNARRHPPEQIEQLAGLITRFGWTMPVLCREGGEIIAGHGRVLAAERLGITAVPVIVARGWSEDECRAYMLADNRIAESATWDEALLKVEIAHLLGAGQDLGGLGFGQAELDALLKGDAPGGIGGADPDGEMPEAPLDPVTRPGDLWRLGAHRLLCGDATSAADVGRLLAGARPHLMVTDPPYGVDYDPAWRTAAGVSNSDRMGRVSNDDRADWREAWALFPGDVAYVWHAGVHGDTVAESLAATGLAIHSQIIWAKPHFALGRGDYHWQHEPCFYAVRRGAKGRWQGARDQSTLWAIGNGDEDAATVHGTQKPVECMRRPMVNNSAGGDAVYEPFAGSGTTVIAAESTGRVCLALEIDPGYCDLIVERWQAFTGREAVLEGEGRSFDDLRGERAAA